ncbi:MAG: NF038129 family PEP-CTERM protein [Methylomonas sp.]|nr:NF038129 family PEP-CTERM protein [Methylomonas sp.]
MKNSRFNIKQKSYLIIFVSQFFLYPAHAAYTTLSATIDTSSIVNTDALIAFDFIPGDSPVLNAVSIFSFLTDGTITTGTAILTGDAIGDLTSNASLQNTSFFNEIMQPISLGNSITFNVTLSQEFSGSIPDALSVFLLDASYMPLFHTTDPTGSDSLFLFSIDGTATGNLNIYAADSAISNPVTWSAQLVTVPIPATVWLFLPGLFSFGLNRHSAKKSRR